MFKKIPELSIFRTVHLYLIELETKPPPQINAQGAHLLEPSFGPGGCALIWAPFSWVSFDFNEKRGCALIGTSFLAAGGATLIRPLRTQRARAFIWGGVYNSNNPPLLIKFGHFISPPIKY
jgi:hypothetical protein